MSANVAPADLQQMLFGLLQAYQIRVWRDRSRVRVIKKSRRIGMSYSEIGRAVLDAIRKNGRNTYYMSHTLSAGIEAMTQVARWADFYDRYFRRRHGRSIWRDGNRKTALTATAAHFASGKKFQVFASSPKQVRGPADAPHYIFDEFAFHQNAAAVLQAALPVLMMGSAAVTVISTVLFEDAFWGLCEDIKAGKRPGSLHEISFDQALAEGYYERIVRSAKRSPFAPPMGVDDPELARRLGVPHQPGARARYREEIWTSATNPETELNLQPMRSGDMYYPPALISACMDQHGAVHRWTAPPGFVHVEESQKQMAIAAYMQSIEGDLERLKRNPPREWYFGIDPARYRDMLTMQFGYAEDGIMRWPFILELEDCPFAMQNFFFDQVVQRIGDRNIRRGAIDKGSNGAQLYEHALIKLGPNVVEGVDCSDAWYREWQPALKRRYEQRTIRHPHDVFHLADMGSVKLIDGVAKVPRGSKKMPSTGDGKARFRHGDFASSNVLGNYAARDAIQLASNTGPGRTTRIGNTTRRTAMRSF